MLEGRFTEITPNLLGDVVISIETAEREGQKANISKQKRLDQLLIHGILHLLGYDHENAQSEALRMEAKTRELLKIIDTEVQ